MADGAKSHKLGLERLGAEGLSSLNLAPLSSDASQHRFLELGGPPSGLTLHTGTSPLFSAYAETEKLSSQLTQIQREMNELKKSSIKGEEFQKRLDQLDNSMTSAISRTNNLNARLILPPSSLTDQYLVPSGALERLEEYRSDEGVALLVVGTFLGAGLGILATWTATDDIIISRASLILLALFVGLMVASIFWVRHIRLRMERAKKQIFGKGIESTDQQSAHGQEASQPTSEPVS